MKTRVLLTAGIVLMLVLTFLAGCSTTGGVAAANGQPINVNVGNQQTGIWVNGEGKVTVTPDIATLNLGVSAQAATVAEAQTQAANAMDQVMNALTSNGVDKKDIKTQYFNIQQVTRWDDKGQQETIIGYRVSNMVTAKIRTLDKIGTIIDNVTAAGGDLTRINGINFSVDDPEKYYAQVRELAMQDAKTKAQQIADLAGVTLGRPTYVVENSNVPPIIYREAGVKYDMAAGAPAPTTPITPGEMDITLNVQVSYAIQ
ncbi:MAG: SIMPL domain-containing protein [Dehalococcoidales bacterium]|nr:SIMPL domain-containing protein [Dehalococcoidales bacterium]